MLRIFYPTEWIDSSYNIDYQKLYKKGFRFLLFDIDNTLVEHGAPASERAIRLVKYLKQLGFRICLMSNNKEDRVGGFANQVELPYIYKAGKPSRKAYLKAMEKIDGNKKTTVFIGDQLFTDIYGANRTGLYSILVNPIDKKEEIQIVFKRHLEKIVLFFYKRHSER